MSGLKKIFVMISIIIAAALFPLWASSDVNLKFRHILSIYYDDKDINLEQPEGVACNEGSHLIVADSGNGRLLRYTFQDGFIQTGAVEIKAAQLRYPMKTEINSKGEIYSLDRRLSRIVRFTPEGEFKDYIDPAGLPDQRPHVPRSFTIDFNDNLYIVDILSERVLILNPEGKYLRHIKFPQEYGFFSDIAVDYKQTVLLIDSVKPMVLSAAWDTATLSPLTESLKEYVRFPASLTTDSRGRIYLLDRNGGSIVILGQDGSFQGRRQGMGWKDGLLNYPSQMCINGKGEVFVADTRNNRVQIFKAVE